MAFVDPGGALRSLVNIGRRSETLPKVVLAEDCELGDILGYSSGWVRALATVGTAIQGRVVALKAAQAASPLKSQKCVRWNITQLQGKSLPLGAMSMWRRLLLTGRSPRQLPPTPGTATPLSE